MGGIIPHRDVKRTESFICYVLRWKASSLWNTCSNDSLLVWRCQTFITAAITDGVSERRLFQKNLPEIIEQGAHVGGRSNGCRISRSFG